MVSYDSQNYLMILGEQSVGGKKVLMVGGTVNLMGKSSGGKGGIEKKRR